MLRMAARPSTRPAAGRPAPLHAFKPTSGTLLGSAGLAIAAIVVVLVVVGERSVLGLRTALGAALLALVIWMVMLRPRVTAYADTLVLRNMASDVHIPLAAIDDVAVRHTLNVHVDDQRYSCAGIGRSTRSMLRDQHGAARSSAQDYVAFVETTIEELSRAARRDNRGEVAPVRRSWAVPELAAGGVLVVALAVTFAL
jgi:hypothetical protein